MAIFSEEFTSSIKSTVKSVKETVTAKLKKPTLPVVAGLAAVGLIGVSATAGVAALGTRHIVGSNVGDKCRVVVDQYVELAELQEGELSTVSNYLSQIQANPWATFAVGGRVSELAEGIGSRWSELDELSTAYYNQCVETDDFMSWVVDPYTIDARRDKWTAEGELEATRDRVGQQFDSLGW